MLKRPSRLKYVINGPRCNRFVIRFMTDLLRKYRGSVVNKVKLGSASPHHDHNWPLYFRSRSVINLITNSMDFHSRFCNAEIENTKHLIYECENAQNIWFLLKEKYIWFQKSVETCSYWIWSRRKHENKIIKLYYFFYSM